MSLHGSVGRTAAAILALAACCASAFAGGPPAARIQLAADGSARELKPCELPALAERAYSGQLDVPEHSGRPRGRRLTLHFAVLPATQGAATSDPIVPLMGGPGEDAISAAAVYAQRLPELRRHRDILLLDQRGTGRSGALRCDLHAGADTATRLHHLFPPEAAQRCAREQRARADLSQYTYENVAHDLERVRRALGYGPLNLSAGSYGTRAAQVFMRLYPDSVRTAYLGSVVPLDVATPMTMAKTAQGQLERMLRSCEADADCRAAFPRLREEFGTIAARLARGEATLAPPGSDAAIRLSQGRVAEWFRSRLYRPATAAELPWLIHQAHAGNWTPIVDDILDNARDMPSALSVGLFLTVTCREDVAFIDERDIAAQSRGTFLGDYRVREQMAACAHWPKPALPAQYRRPPRSQRPVLFVSGDSDGASPLWFTQRVAQAFADRVEIVARNQGHTEWSGCIARRYERFVREGSTRGIESSACEDVPRPPFRLR